MSNILRRYFVMNAFDGVLTIFGVLIGAYVAGINESSSIIHIGIGTTIAVGISGLWGAFFTESAERKKEICTLERALDRKLEGTDIDRACKTATVLAAIVDALSPMLALAALLPFVFIEIKTAYLTSFGVSMLLFFILGTFLGKISKSNMFLSGIKFLTAGIICLVIIWILE